jgi:prepilin-type N-terminal cleavage/methylation domain-containing protein
MYQDIERRFARMPVSAYPPTMPRHSYFKGQTRYDLRGASRGFTVIELVIVVVILAIAALTAVPMMSSAASMQIRSAANMISADLEYAKSMAISRGQDFSVVFDESTDSYRIEDQVGTVIQHPVKKGFTYVVDFRNDSRLSKVDISNVGFGAASESRIKFDCLGSPDNGGTVSLQAGTTTTTITVEPVTGYISIQ